MRTLHKYPSALAQVLLLPTLFSTACASSLSENAGRPAGPSTMRGPTKVVEVAGERVDSLIKEDVLLVKLDVEGFEPTAF